MSRSFPSNARSRWSSVARTTFADVLSDDDRVATTAAPAHDQREHGDDDNGKDTEPQGAPPWSNRRWRSSREVAWSVNLGQGGPGAGVELSPGRTSASPAMPGRSRSYPSTLSLPSRTFGHGRRRRCAGG